MNFFATPPIGIYHGFGPTRRVASAERICIPTFTECSTGKFTTFQVASVATCYDERNATHATNAELKSMFSRSIRYPLR